MIKLGPRHFLCETTADLPNPRPGRIFLDVETRSRHDDLNFPGNEPYLGDRICMLAVAFDDDGPAFCAAVRMRDSAHNLPLLGFRAWLRDLLATAEVWTNHNIKFDAHFAHVDGAEFAGTMDDTLTRAKVFESDRMDYGLKTLSKEWFGADVSSVDKVRAFLDGYKLPRNKKCNDYAVVPTDLLAFYNCDDVLINRDLSRFLDVNMPSELIPTVEMEEQLTPCLFDMEVSGLRTDEQDLKIEKVKSIHKQIKLSTMVNAMTGLEFVDSSKFSYSLLVANWGLPILAYNPKSGNPTFDADALALYQSHPEVVIDPVKSQVLNAIIALREEITYCSLFVDCLLDKRDANGYIHPMYNQLVRTGRMSCKDPNAQQFNEMAKQLILTDNDDCLFLDADASQIEFRFIVHYIQDEDAITAYRADSKTDFHTWVAELCGIPRKPAKNINFAQAFGGGKKKIVSMLAAEPSIIGELSGVIDAAIADGSIKPENRIREFSRMAWTRGENVYNTYHDRLPNLKTKAKKAEMLARQRGFIKNMYGRRRNLGTKRCHIAFNTVVQGSAMDLIKRRIIATAPRYNPELKSVGITQRVNVHDSLLFHGPREAILEYRPWILAKLEAPEPLLRVPLYWDSDIYEGRWRPRNL